MIWVLGFTLPFPGLLLPGRTYSPRYTDLAVALCIPLAWSAYNRLFRPGQVMPLCIGWLAAVIVPAVVHVLLFGGLDAGDVTYYLRWILAILLGAPLAWVMPERREFQYALLLGIVAGAALHLISIWISVAGGTSFLRSIGWASVRVLSTSYHGESRVTSLAEHPNFAMILLGLAVPAAMSYRLLSPPNRGLPTIAVAIVILVSGFYLTLTRTATLAALAAILVAMLQFFKRSDRFVMYFRAAFALLAVAMIVLAMQLSQHGIAQDRLVERIASKGLGENLQGRADTISATIDLLLTYPLGVGWSQYLTMGALADHIRASHNGYLFTARVIGIPAALLLIVGHARLLWRTLRTRRIDALPPFICFLVVVMCAEDVTQGMPMVFLATFLAICGWHGEPWASVVYRSVLVPPARPAKRSPATTTGAYPIR